MSRMCVLNVYLTFFICQKRPTTVFKETHECQKRPTKVSKETYWCQNRLTIEAKETYYRGKRDLLEYLLDFFLLHQYAVAVVLRCMV
jgi:hypothetical protein